MQLNTGRLPELSTARSEINKCNGDDKKPAARHSPNCIINKVWRQTIFNMADGILTPCNVACGSEITTVNSPSGSTLQCDTWLWDDMPFNSPKRPIFEVYIWFRFRPYHRSRHVILHQSVKFYTNRTTLGRKKTRSALGRAHVPPTKVFRRMSRHSRVDYSNAVFAVSGKLVGPYY